MATFTKIFSNTAAPVAGKMVSVLVSIAIVKLLSTNLGIDGFGFYITILEFVAIFAVASDFGIYAISVSELAACEKSKAPRIIGNVVGMRLIAAAVSMLIAGIAVTMIPVYEHTPIVLGVWLAISMVILNSVTGSLEAILQVNYEIKYATLAAVVGKLIRLLWIVLIIIILNPAGVNWLEWNAFSDLVNSRGGLVPLAIYLVIAGFTVGNLVQFLVAYYYAHRFASVSLRFEMSYWKTFLRKSLPYGVAVFLGAAYFRIDTLLLSFIEGPESVGLYAIAMRLIENGAYIPVVFINALLPALALYLRKQDHEKVEELLRKSWLFLLSISVAFALLATTYAVPLTLIFSSRDYVSGNLVRVGSDIAIQISVWALVFSSLNRLFVFTSLAMGKQYKILFINAVGVTFNLVTNLIFIPRYGMIAAAITTVVSEGIVLILNFGVVYKAIRFKPPGKTSLEVIGTAVVVFGLSGVAVHRFMNPESIVAMLIVGAASCVAYLYILKATSLRTYLASVPAPWRWINRNYQQTD